jgi:menaquinol-cytochrome c reductase iron-sulfur subunit
MAEPKQKERADFGAESAPGGEVDPARRALIVLGGVLYAAAIAVPAVGFATGASPAATDGKARWVRVGRLADLEPGKPRRLKVVADERDAFTVTKDQVLGSVWLIREGEGVRALSATCPHLGCSIDASADAKSFGCPCHASRFSLAGVVEEGPSPRAMDPLDARVTADGLVEVDFRRFVTGISARKEAGA